MRLRDDGESQATTMLPAPQILRHRTAIGRSSLSRPFTVAIEAGLLTPDAEVFDYGCGRGDDLRFLTQLNIRADGWDPAHRPDAARRPADLVNLGYVVNVIENSEERSDCLRLAWGLARKVLIVAARLTMDAKKAACDACGDGCLTTRSTFQKFYTQTELREWIDRTLGATSVAAAPGVFFVFRDDLMRQSFLASRYRRKRAAPKLRKSDVLFETHRALLEPLIRFLTERARLPAEWELPEAQTISEVFGSLPRAYTVIKRVTGAEQWESIRHERAQELLLYLALDRFGGRARYGELPPDLQLDVREFFSTYNKACAQADALLFSAGNLAALNQAQKASPVGKLTGNALYIHVSALHELPPILRVYEGCARAYIGVVDGANLVKLHRQAAEVSYLLYPDFDSDPHPALSASLIVNLQRLDIQYREYGDSENPFILHRKEDFVAADYPLRAKFEKLTGQEEKAGLHDNPSVIGTRNAWNALLQEKSLRLRGHQLCRSRAPKTSELSVDANDPSAPVLRPEGESNQPCGS